ncbi:tRNA1(Val) (adenine(37)-N6)-methyltransferase [Roseivivax isoporae]|uniref:Methyltransferase n=1 Tax=Roseivivax isoporae LMG 25204 TaxID=1449351 RepID=X7FEW9_9RHOB|nr:methyltransferase domain-containing protein [Roseivivax isoporae]ETX30529.1 methyltransferase [Roseivivax isoporae LMG 25204]
MSDEAFADADLTQDAFLGGRVRLWQPRRGYRSGVDPVLLAASVAAVPGQRVLDLGCGAGAAMLCLGARVPGLDLTGVELQPAYARLARRNAADAECPARVVTADVAALPPDLRQETFDHVIANPPYFEPARRQGAADPGRETGLAGPTPLADWVATAARRTAHGGSVTFIQRVERLPELLAAFDARLGGIEFLPLAPRVGRPARLILLRGRKGGRAAFRALAPLILHAGDRHESDAEDYAPAVAAILRDGAPLRFSP